MQGVDLKHAQLLVLLSRFLVDLLLGRSDVDVGVVESRVGGAAFFSDAVLARP